MYLFDLTPSSDGSAIVSGGKPATQIIFVDPKRVVNAKINVQRHRVGIRTLTLDKLSSTLNASFLALRT